MVILWSGHLGHSRRTVGEGREIRFTASQHVCNKHHIPGWQWEAAVSASSALTLQKGPTPANSLGMVGFSEGWKVREGALTSAKQEAKHRSRRTACCKVTTLHAVCPRDLHDSQARPGQRSRQDPTSDGGGRGWEQGKNITVPSGIAAHPPGTRGSGTL